MRAPTCLLLAILAAPAVSPAKTTYGETRAVAKSDPPSDGGGGSSDDDYGCEDCDRSGGSSFGGSDDEDDRRGDIGFRIKPEARGIGSCFQIEYTPRSAGEAFGAAIALPFWYALCPAVYEFAAGPVHLALGNQDSQHARRDRLRFGLGFHVGLDWVTETASGPATGGHFEAVGPLARVGFGTLDFRLRGEAARSALAIDVDYERDVFEDTGFIGVEHDRMNDYSRWAFPLSAELLWFPGTRGLYLGAGAGATRLRETERFHRESPMGTGDLTGGRDSWIPATSISIGRESLGRHGRPNWYFEVRWQALLFEPRHRSSFPADNAAGSHGIGWVRGWYL